MAQDLDRKLRATAYLLGTVTRKDLAAAFRRVNPATSFDVERANKWVQGRAQPREAQLYRDWATLLELDRSAEWVANCDFESFVEVVAAKHNFDRDALRLNGGNPKGRRKPDDPNQGLSGTYVCYSHAWSPYFRGQIIRGALSITGEEQASGLRVTYTEVLPTGRLDATGKLSPTRRALNFEVRETDGDALFFFCLFSPTFPVRVLGGLMCGATIIGSDPGPSVARTIMIRMPSANKHLLDEPSAYLPTGMSLGADLSGLGVTVPQTLADDLSEFLNAGDGGGLDQPSSSAFRTLIEQFNREWLATLDL